MATFLDTLGVIDFFAPIFASLLVLVVVWALLAKTQILGDNKAIQGFVAVILAIVILLVPNLVKMINFIAPWFVFLFVLGVLILLLYRMFGLEEKDIGDYFRNDRTINIALFGIAALIFVAAIFVVFGESALEATQGDETEFKSSLYSIIFSPQVLGVGLVFAIAIFAILFLGGQASP